MRSPTFCFLAVLIALGGFVGACGGGGGGGGDGEEIVETSLVRVVWPGPTAVTDQPSMRIRGISPDPVDVTAVTVGGVPAVTGDGFATWHADVVLGLGLNVLEVDVTDGDGTELPAHVVVRVRNVGHVPVTVRAMALDALGNRLLLVGPRLLTLSAVDLATGVRRVISGDGVGAGPALEDPESIALDRPNDRAYVVEGSQGPRALLRVDLTTGDRTIVSTHGLGSGANFNEPFGAVFDDVGDRVLVTDRSRSALIAVDPVTGNRTEISDNVSVGVGDDFTGPYDLVLDAAHSMAWVSDRPFAVVRVALATGDRTIVCDRDIGAGEDFQTISGIVEDAADDRLVAADENSGGPIRGVDKTTGDRTILSDEDRGGGPDLDRPSDLEPGTTAGRVFACENTHGSSTFSCPRGIGTSCIGTRRVVDR